MKIGFGVGMRLLWANSFWGTDFYSILVLESRHFATSALEFEQKENHGVLQKTYWQITIHFAQAFRSLQH